MPNDQPSNAPDIDADTAPTRDGETVASVLSDPAMDETPGGGGLMGAGGGGADAATAMGKVGAATPNSPIDAELPLEGGSDEGLVEKEAQTRALGDGPADE